MGRKHQAACFHACAWYHQRLRQVRHWDRHLDQEMNRDAVLVVLVVASIKLLRAAGAAAAAAASKEEAPLFCCADPKLLSSRLPNSARLLFCTLMVAFCD